MPPTRSNAHELKVILSVSKDENEKSLIELVEKIDFEKLKIVYTWDDLVEQVKTKKYDLVITRTHLGEEDTIQNIQKNKFFNKHKTPVIFILRNDLIKSQMTLIGNFMARFLNEKTLSEDLLDYSVRDIYHQNKLERLRRENELRYKKLFEHSYDINIIVNKKFSVIEGNEQYTNQVGKRLHYKLDSLFIYAGTFNRFKELLEVNKAIRSFKAEILLFNEPSNCLIDSFKLYNEDSELIGYHLIIRDIDQEFRIQQLANRANNLMTTGKFMRSLAHEIRNPLTNLQLAMEQLSEDLVASENSELFFNIMNRSTTRITELLNKLMNAYQSGEVILKEVDLSDIVRKGISLAQDRISLRNIVLKTHFNISPVIVQADFEKMSTAILNLIVNAIEAMDKTKKTIDITIENNKKGNVILCVQDNAKGMDQEQLEAIFNPFYTGKSKGIGLGLTTTQNIVLAHGWEIDVESKPGIGTRFIITTQ